MYLKIEKLRNVGILLMIQLGFLLHKCLILLSFQFCREEILNQM